MKALRSSQKKKSFLHLFNAIEGLSGFLDDLDLVFHDQKDSYSNLARMTLNSMDEFGQLDISQLFIGLSGRFEGKMAGNVKGESCMLP